MNACMLGAGALSVGDKTYREEAEADGAYELAGGYCG